MRKWLEPSGRAEGARKRNDDGIGNSNYAREADDDVQIGMIDLK